MNYNINYELCRTVVIRANSTTLALEESSVLSGSGTYAYQLSGQEIILSTFDTEQNFSLNTEVLTYFSIQTIIYISKLEMLIM